MSQNRPLTTVTRKLPEAVEAQMVRLFDVRLNASDAPMDEAVLRAALNEAEILVPTVSDRIGPALIEGAGPQLKLIANFGAGTDHIALDAARARGIPVTNTPDVLTEDTADIAMTLMLCVLRRAIEGAKLLEAGEFKGWHPTWMMGHRFSGRTLGIIGMGRIGLATARRARAFGVSIHYHNRKPISPELTRELQVTYWPDLDAMLGHIDILSIHCPRTPETHHLMSAERLALMKKGAFLVNTARGDIVDEAALAEALITGRLAGAGLDVYEHEPQVHPKLIGLSNAVLLPHLGSGTIESRTAMGEKVIANIEAFLTGKKLPNRVV